MNDKYIVSKDVDTGGWWVHGPTIVVPLPRWVSPSIEVANALAESLNDAYQTGLKHAVEMDKRRGKPS